MEECKLVDRLAVFVPVPNDVLQNAVLRLLLNLSFDAAMREDMVKNGLIQKVPKTSHAHSQFPWIRKPSGFARHWGGGNASNNSPVKNTRFTRLVEGARTLKYLRFCV